MSTQPKYNLSIAPLMQSKNGNLTWRIDDEVFEKLQNVKVGDKLLVKFLAEDRRKSEKSPHAYLEIIDKAEVDAFNAQFQQNNAI